MPSIENKIEKLSNAEIYWLVVIFALSFLVIGFSLRTGYEYNKGVQDGIESKLLSLDCAKNPCVINVEMKGDNDE